MFGMFAGMSKKAIKLYNSDNKSFVTLDMVIAHFLWNVNMSFVAEQFSIFFVRFKFEVYCVDNSISKVTKKIEIPIIIWRQGYTQ